MARAPVDTALLLVLALSPLALAADTMAVVDGHRASYGQVGAPGAATAATFVDGRGEEFRRGRFAPTAAANRAGRSRPGSCRTACRRSPATTGPEPGLGADGWTGFLPVVVHSAILSPQLPLVRDARLQARHESL